jgi:RNA polymerase-interacting CarD/CdnL/TRCF family regulator
LEDGMTYNIGDKVIHYNFGFSEIIGVEEKMISGVSQKYYVVRTNGMLLWIPYQTEETSKLRPPSSRNEFNKFFSILRSKYSPLSSERNVRKSQIQGRFVNGSTESICTLIRDLSFYKNQKKLNEYDSSIFERAIHNLIDEWGYAFNIPQAQARVELNKLLLESYSASK